MFKVDHIDHVALTVRDVERSVAWYKDVLGLERRYQDVWGGYPAVVCAGMTCLALFPTESGDSRPPPGRDTIAMRHIGFAVDRANFERARERFRELGIEFSFEDHTICHSLYIFDPDGHQLEITTYEV
jgi:catechol 2,3-dioxygenase-like lactoylglutathione lyase family enzyme